MCEKIEVGKRKNDDRRRSREGVGARSQVGCSLYGLRIVMLICYIYGYNYNNVHCTATFLLWPLAVFVSSFTST